MPSVELDDRFVRVPSVDLQAFCFTVGRLLPDTAIECEGLLALLLASALPSVLALVLLVLLPRALPVQTVLALSPFARRLGPPSFSPYSRSL